MTVKPPPSPITNSLVPVVTNHVNQYVNSKGMNGQFYKHLRYCLITTKGRVTGIWRRTALLYFTHENYIYVIASDHGNPTSPDWYKNLLIEPEVWMQVGTDCYWGKANILDAEEELALRGYLWSKACKAWPEFVEYQEKRPDDLFPIVLIERL